MVKDPNDPKEKGDKTEDNQDEKKPDFISEITKRINAGTLESLDLLLIDDVLSSQKVRT